MPVVDPQYRGEVRVELYLPPAFDQFPPSKILVPAFWAQRGIQQPLRAIRVRQGLRVLSPRLDDIADQAETSGAGGVLRTSESPTEAAVAGAKHAGAAGASAKHAVAAGANALHAVEVAAEATHADAARALATHTEAAVAAATHADVAGASAEHAEAAGAAATHADAAAALASRADA